MNIDIEICGCCGLATCHTVQELVACEEITALAGLLSASQVTPSQIRTAVARLGTYPVAAKTWEAWLAAQKVNTAELGHITAVMGGGAL